MENESATQRMREVLAPRGSLKSVRLHLNNYGYVDPDFVRRCLDEVDMLSMKQMLGENPSNLEKLAVMLLIDSAYIELSKEKDND